MKKCIECKYFIYFRAGVHGPAICIYYEDESGAPLLARLGYCLKHGKLVLDTDTCVEEKTGKKRKRKPVYQPIEGWPGDLDPL